VPVDHGRILEVLAKDKVCVKEVFVELGEKRAADDAATSRQQPMPAAYWEGAEAS